MNSIRIFIDDEGVSPIVATLVLIVVAIIGASTVALIMGSFSSNVANQGNSASGATQAAMAINVVGLNMPLGVNFSTDHGVVDYGGPSGKVPLALLCKWYSNNNTAVTVNAVGGGSTAGLAALEQGAADIAVMSEDPAADYANDINHYNLKSYQIGESGICWVSLHNGETTIAKSQLINAYSTGNLANVQFGWPLDGNYATAAIVDTTDKNVMMKYLGINSLASNVVLANGQEQVCNNIWWGRNGAYPIAYLDSSYALTNPVKVEVLDVYDDTTGKAYPATWDNIQNEIMDYQAGGSDPNTYPAGLIKPQVLITKGSPSALDQAFIKYVQSPGSADTFSSNDMVHVSQIGSYWRLAPPGE